jgi:hypothetical protein
MCPRPDLYSNLMEKSINCFMGSTKTIRIVDLGRLCCLDEEEIFGDLSSRKRHQFENCSNNPFGS